MPVITVKECLTEGPCRGQGHSWEFDAPRLKELRQLQANGLTLGQFEKGLNDLSSEFAVQAMTGLLWMLHRRDGAQVRWEDIDASLSDFDVGMTPEEQAEYDAAKAELGKAAAEAAEQIRTSGIATEVDLTPRSPDTPPDSGSTSD